MLRESPLIFRIRDIAWRFEGLKPHYFIYAPPDALLIAESYEALKRDVLASEGVSGKQKEEVFLHHGLTDYGNVSQHLLAQLRRSLLINNTLIHPLASIGLVWMHCTDQALGKLSALSLWERHELSLNEKVRKIAELLKLNQDALLVETVNSLQPRVFEVEQSGHLLRSVPHLLERFCNMPDDMSLHELNILQAMVEESPNQFRSLCHINVPGQTLEDICEKVLAARKRVILGGGLRQVSIDAVRQRGRQHDIS